MDTILVYFSAQIKDLVTEQDILLDAVQTSLLIQWKEHLHSVLQANSSSLCTCLEQAKTNGVVLARYCICANLLPIIIRVALTITSGQDRPKQRKPAFVHSKVKYFREQVDQAEVRKVSGEIHRSL